MNGQKGLQLAEKTGVYGKMTTKRRKGDHQVETRECRYGL